MKLKITTWQRTVLSQIMNMVRGNLSRIRKAMKALEILDLSPDEMKLVGYVELPNGSANWEDVDHRWDIEIKDKEVIHLVKAEVQRYQNWPVSMHEQIFDLTNQMGISLDEKEEQKEESEEE